MAASPRVLLSPSTLAIRVGVLFTMELTCRWLPWLPLYLHFALIHLLIACIAHNWHLPAICDSILDFYPSM